MSKAFARAQDENRAYVSIFVSRVLARQQHTHLFLVVVCGASARIVRADREAFFVTHPFTYKTSPTQSILREFFRRFTEMDRAERGIDTTAKLLRCKRGTGYTSERISFMRQMANSKLDGASDHARMCFEESLDDDWPWYSVTVQGLEFLIAKPAAYSDKPSRASRGYIALCYSMGPLHGTFVWLKDTWRRILDDEYEQEGAVLSDLNRHRVEYVPTLVCHADVSSHRLDVKGTLARLCKQGPKPARSRIERVHYRVVTQEVGLPVDEFRNSRDLAVVFRDCLEAHRSAYKRAKILHRDLSEGNLLMVPYDAYFEDGAGIAYRGMLIDWEYGERVSRRSAPGFVYRVDRRGTWDFLSVKALNRPEDPVMPADEFEAFLHIFTSLGLSYLRHSCKNPVQFDKEYFGTQTIDSVTRASALKERCMRHGRLFVSVEGNARLEFLKETRKKLPRCRTVVTRLVPHPIDRVFTSWLALIRERYAPEKELDAQCPQIVPRPVAPSDKENVSPRKAPPAHRAHASPLACLELNVDVPFSESFDSDDDEDSEVALHDAMIEILSDAIEHSFWPPLDKTLDQLEVQEEELENDKLEERLEVRQCLSDDEDDSSPSTDCDRPNKRRRIG
ncbi:hypothetical protein K466DRAFT_522193 [Polyporus arcularius HHB13444]|uniref:Fungal-type protein kinase domain-containing protein n=1 Tax=Polyporus arcularius HHB13444 TaxID=1314778 RepID=A0A5C3PG57_9APHY|nr:hypothetical protein K466DRAFT_522193 [Polyporus arcularius HHB13444]